MTVGLLLVTHEGVGDQLGRVAHTIFDNGIDPVTCISLPSDLEPAVLGKYADLVRDAMLAQERNDGLLVLTDVFGATPDNLARYFASGRNVRVVSGINLPMLLRVLNYAHLTLEQLCETALEGGKTGVHLE